MKGTKKTMKEDLNEDSDSDDTSVAEAQTLSRIYEEISKKLPSEDDRELLGKITEAMKNGGADKAKELVSEMISELSGEA